MHKALLTIVAFAGMTATAQAGCGTKALNGTWLLQGVDDVTYNELVILDGMVAGGGTISQSKTSCKVTMIISALTIKGRTENVAGTSRKPHVMTLYNETSGEMGVMVRK